MRNITIKKWTVLACLFALFAATVSAQSIKYQLKKYEDQQSLGILYGLTGNGLWGIIQNGSSAAGGSARPQVFNTKTGKAEDRGSIGFQDITDDANIAVGSSSDGRPAVYNHTTGKVTAFTTPSGTTGGFLIKVTPDGKWAVGKCTTADDMCYSSLLVNVETGETVATPGLPQKDMQHQNENENTFFNITPDGRYVIGMMSDCYLSPAQLFTYVYDTQSHTYDVVGFKPHDNAPWEPLADNIYFIDGGTLSPDGHYLAGEAYIVEENDEYSVPYRYDLQTKEFKVFNTSELKGRIAYAVDNKGTILLASGSKGAATPLRDFSVYYQDKYVIPFSTICQQYYGFNFFNTTGFENTGTPVGISGDGSKLAAFPDPQGESYWFDFGCSVEEVCANIDLLAGYTAMPEDGAELSSLQTITLAFDRSVVVNGDWSDVELIDSKGNFVANVATSGFHVNSEATNEVLLQFSQRRPPVLTPGEEYTVVVKAGTISIPGDPSIKNKEIRISYTGRENRPVEVISIYPAAGSDLAQLDNVSSYITLNFDTKILVSGSANATLQREDGTVIAYLSTFYGNNSGKGQVTVIPSSTCYLYDGQRYEVVINAGCITDLSGDKTSANAEIRIPYNGIYQRPVPQDGIIFEDNFNSMATSLNTWLRYDGDHLNPTKEMESMEFDADNQPWNFSVRDEGTADICAASHSMYSPAGKSQDIMMTPLLEIPNDDKVTLEFDAQSYRRAKTDILKVKVYEENTQYSFISDYMALCILNDADEVFCQRLLPGASENELKGDWQHYTVNLGEKYKNKNIYIAFVNDNEDQSMIFVDNVKVQRESFYELSFTNEEEMVAQESVEIKGRIKVLKTDATGTVSLTLRNAAGEAVDKVTLDNAIVNQPIGFQFKAMPLVVGKKNDYCIDIVAGKMEDKYESSITNLSFATTKHVVLEEMTGQGCPNCPLGILTIDRLREQYGELFIPVSLHTYTGDRLGQGMTPYNSFLGLGEAPSARINRIPIIYYPMYSVGNTYYDEYEGTRLWRMVVDEEMHRMAPADVTLKATLTDANTITLESDITFALSYNNKLYNVMYIVMEDGLIGRQSNNLYMISKQTVLGEWCEGGQYATSVVYPFVFDDVARATFGNSFSGTSGLIPSEIVAGSTYKVTQAFPRPENIVDINKVHVAMLLIDPSTGLVDNAVQANLDTTTGIEPITISKSNANNNARYNLAGQRVDASHKGIIIENGKRFIQR